MQEKVIEFLSKKTGVPASEIHPETSLLDLNVDSFVFLEIILDFEQEFGITVSDRELAGLNQVSDIIRLVEKK